MKKEDAKYILDAIEWMNENTTVASVNMETYGNLFMNSQSLLMDVVNGAEQSDSNCNIPLVVQQSEQYCECGAKHGMHEVENNVCDKCDRKIFP